MKPEKKSKDERITTGDVKITSVQPAGKHSMMIVIPKKMCIALGIEVDDAVKIVKKKKTLVISKVPAESLD